MTIEEKVFKRKRFIPGRMSAYGFKEGPSGSVWEADFMDGEFRAIVTVTEKGRITGSVIDRMNGEEYAQLRMERLSGAYVNSVRAAYEALLEQVADACCEDVLFAFDQANRIARLILEAYEVSPDFPWKQGRYQSYGTFRHADSGKWFALIMNISRDALLGNKSKDTIDVINLKVDPLKTDTLTKAEGIFPGYHMNHKNWISAVLDERISDEEIMKLVANSFSLT